MIQRHTASQLSKQRTVTREMKVQTKRTHAPASQSVSVTRAAELGHQSTLKSQVPAHDRGCERERESANVRARDNGPDSVGGQTHTPTERAHLENRANYTFDPPVCECVREMQSPPSPPPMMLRPLDQPTGTRLSIIVL